MHISTIVRYCIFGWLVCAQWTNVAAATDVGGIVNTNTTWSVSGSPYRLTANVQIDYGTMLRIDPGVQVEGNGRNLEVFGSLVAGGNVSAVVTFVDTIILGAKDNTAARPFMIEVRFARIKGGSFLSATGGASYGSFSMRDSTLSDLINYTYIWYPTADCYIERNQFIRTYGLSIGHRGPSVFVRNNLFFQTKAAYAGYPAVMNWAAYQGSTVVEYNTFQDLKTYAVALPSGYSPAAMSAQNNYWGTTDLTAISAMIFDRNDDLSSGGIIPFQPILSSPHAATPTALAAPTISTQPSGRTVDTGTSVTFTVSASGLELAYQWQKGGTAIAGATTSSYTINTTTSADAGTYTVVVTNASSSVTSNPATLTVNAAPPVLTTQPSSRTVVAGTIVTFTVNASGLGLAYQWQKGGTPIAGATTSSYTINTTTSADAGTYTVVVTNASGSVTSNPATLTVNAAPLPPVFTTQPSNQSVVAGNSTVLMVATSGTSPVGYQWQRNGTTIAGAASAALTVTNVQPADSGIYQAQISTTGGTTTSRGAILGVASIVKLVGAGTEFPDIFHPGTGFTYDQILLAGAAAAVTADSHQILRISFIDLNDDIVQVEFSGAGTLSIVLDSASGPALPVKYNQTVAYMKGHAGIIVTGANESTHLSVFSVGRAIPGSNPALYRDSITYDGFADIAYIAITSTDDKFGGLRAANTACFGTKGLTGIYAPNVHFTGPVFINDVNASDTATPVIIIGSGDDVRVAGGDLLQTNGKAVQVSGITQLRFTAGSSSHGTFFSAQTNHARLEKDGVEVTAQIVVNP